MSEQTKVQPRLIGGGYMVTAEYDYGKPDGSAWLGPDPRQSSLAQPGLRVGPILRHHLAYPSALNSKPGVQGPESREVATIIPILAKPDHALWGKHIDKERVKYYLLAAPGPGSRPVV